MTDVVVFDLGGVVSAFHPERRLAALAAATGLDVGDIERSIWTSGLDERSERGELTYGETVDLLLESLDRRLGTAALRQAWARAFEPDRAVLAIVERTTVRRYVFTNNGPFLNTCLGAEVTALVDGVICSCDLRARKPERAAFERLAGALGVEPSAITYIDDDEGNCQAAELTGMRAVQFVGPVPLARRLGELGLLRAARR